MREIGRWRFMLGRHIKEICGFSSVSSCDKRLKALIEAGYIERKKYIYGIAGLYTLTHKGRILAGFNKRAESIRLERINHDTVVMDVVIYFIKDLSISTEHIITEKELHIKDGFGVSRHHPDFVIIHQERKSAVEIELNLKEKKRFEKNIKDNYLNYDEQIWVVPKAQKKIIEILENCKNHYNGLSIKFLEDLRNI
jgi:hypothetical protein